MTAHETLVAAKGYLLNNGWTQGEYGYSTGGPRCLVGALVEAIGGWDHVPRMSAITPDATEALCDAIGTPYYSQGFVTTFNDHPERTFNEVIAALDKVILATAPKQAETLEPVPA